MEGWKNGRKGHLAYSGLANPAEPYAAVIARSPHLFLSSLRLCVKIPRLYILAQKPNEEIKHETGCSFL